MVGQVNFSHKELQNKSCNDIQDMLITQKGVNWNDLPTYQKRGSCIVKNCLIEHSYESGLVVAKLRNINEKESAWIVDKDIPIFKGEGREYIERLI
jgi:tRNA(His) 5'-end guanylyltransferase